MAKRKLSQAQRVAIRKNIRSKIAEGVPKAEVLRTIADQYQVSPETVRWYLKTGTNGAAAHLPKAKVRTNASRRKRGSAGRRARAARKGNAANGRAHGLLALVRRVSQEGLKRALAAKKLMPKIESKLAQKLRLEGLARKVKKALRMADRQVARLKRKVARLIAR